jgi:TonB family protein
MREIAVGFFLAGLALHAQPDLLNQSPAVIARCAPQYTPEAKRANIEGTVLLYIQVYPDGRAHNIRLQSSLGSGLDEKAIEAVKQWRFSPGTKNGKPVVVPATIEVKFRLNDPSEPCRAGPPQFDESKPQNGRI